MNKPRLVLLPGLLNDERLWAAQINALSDRFAITVGNLTGHDTMTGLADAVLASVPEERFALAGLSMGGYTALEIIRRAPERVTALALLDTSARPDTPEASENRRKQIALAASDFTAVIDGLFPKLVLPAHAADPGLADLFRDMARSVGPQGFERQQKAIIGRADSRPHLAHITCPTLILCGRDDGVTPVAVHEEMAAAIPGAVQEIIETCGHLSALEQPDAVTQALSRWLGRRD